jgi:UDP-N-acetylglucosamine:LPS N-acetylglucosamine transferase
MVQIFHASIAAKILGIYPFQARSHAFVATALMVELAKRGHEVTVLTHNPYKEEIANFTQIVVKTTMLDVVKDKGKASYDLTKAILVSM